MVLVSWPNAKTKALFQILVSERGRYFNKDRLIEWLWPEAENLKSAEANLRGRIRELRLLLEPSLKKGSQSQYILMRREGYCFNPQADCKIDVEEFASHLREGERLFREGSLGEALEAFEGAIQLYQGPYLPEVPYEDWALEKREHWQGEYLKALEQLAELNAQLGHFVEARARCLQILKLAPYREAVLRQLMRLHTAAGERAEALRVYERYREVLQRELGREPSPATQALYEGIKQGQPLTKEVPLPEPAEGLRLGELPLVGRRGECHRLLERLAQTRAGRGGLVLIMGEAGVGKTRLMQEILNELGHQEWQVLSGRCPTLETPPALTAIAEALRAGLEEKTLDTQVLKELPPAWAAELAELIPDLAFHLPELPALFPLPPEWKRLRLFEALSQLLLKLAARKPLLLFLDDLHAADSSTLDWLKMFLPRAQKAPLLVLAAARAEEAEDVLSLMRQEGRRHGWLVELSLKRLDREAVQELVQQLSAQPELAQLLFDHAQGNPFFIMALLGLLIEQGMLRPVPKEGRWQLATVLSEGAKLLPPEVQELLRRRLEHLSHAERELLYLTSVFGSSVPTALLWKAWGQPDFAILEGLLRKQLLIERGEEIAFIHELLHEVAYAEMSEARRRAFHGRIAQILETTGAAPTLLFHHLLRSEEPAKALEPGLQALEQARRTYLNKEALQIAQRLLELLEVLPELGPQKKEELAFEIHAHRFDIFGLLGKRSEQEHEIQALFTLADRLGSYRQAQVYRRRALVHEASGHLEEACRDARRALELASEEAEQAESHLLLGNLALDLGDLVQASEHYQAALQLYESYGDHRGRAQALNNLGIIHYYLGRYDQAEAYYTQALGLSRQLHDQREMGKILNNLGDVYGLRGDWEQAEACLSESARIRQEIGDRRGELITLANLGELCIRRGKPEAAQERLAQAKQLAVDLQTPALEAAVRARLAWAELVHRQLKSALSEAQKALSLVEGGQAAEFAPELYFRAFQVFDAAGQMDKATRTLQKAHEELQRRAQALPEPFRGQFLEGVLTHREILQAYQERLQPQN